MTPNQKAAVERVKRYEDGDDPCEVYREQLKAMSAEGLETVAWSCVDDDRKILADAFLAECDETRTRERIRAILDDPDAYEILIDEMQKDSQNDAANV